MKIGIIMETMFMTLNNSNTNISTRKLTFVQAKSSNNSGLNKSDSSSKLLKCKTIKHT